MTADDIEIEDIARGLSNICRFGGQIEKFYSVAQHSVICAEVAEYLLKHPKEIVVSALLHDASEAYLGDFIRPIKKNFSVGVPPHGKILSINEVEDNICECLSEKIKIRLYCGDPRVKYIDMLVFNAESYYLRGYLGDERYPLLKHAIIPLPPKEAYAAFIKKLKELNITSDQIHSYSTTSYSSNIEPSNVDRVIDNYDAP